MEKIIWMYWHQGFKKAPSIISLCVKKWKALHPDWKVQLLDQHSIHKFIDPLPIESNKLEKMSLAHRSDLIRTQLLIKYGGVWADPTIFPLQKLDNWLPDNIKANLFFFYKPGRDRIISNWFIAAYPNNEFLKVLYAGLIRYWDTNNFKNLGRTDTPVEKQLCRLINRNLWLPQLWFSIFFTKIIRVYPYMVYHYMVYHITNNNRECNIIFKEMPKLSATPMLKLNASILLNDLDTDIKILIDNKKLPLFKLTHKIKCDTIPENSNLGYLIKN